LADEATGNLDTKTSHEIMDVLERLNDAGKTIIMVTHEDDIALHAKRIIRMRDGLIIDDSPSPRMQQKLAANGAASSAAIDGSHGGQWTGAAPIASHEAKLARPSEELTH
jgi:putative ABC transport system ATP-binding protein